MVAGQVGEGGGGDRQTVEAELREPVARRLERRVLDAALRESGKNVVQRHRVGCRQRAGAAIAGCYEPERAEARRRQALRRPDLARKLDDRGLAVGAGDRGHGVRRPAVKARREKRETAMRVGIDDNGDALALRRRQPEGIDPIGQDRNRAAGNRLGGEVPPVKLGAGQGGKKKARPDRGANRR